MIKSAFSLTFNGKVLNNNQKDLDFDRTIYQVTTTTNGHGSINASPTSGIAGSQVTLSNTASAGYTFSGYSITGATLTGNKFTLNDDVTARANFIENPHILSNLGTAEYIDSGQDRRTFAYFNLPSTISYNYVDYCCDVRFSSTTAGSMEGTGANFEIGKNDKTQWYAIISKVNDNKKVGFCGVRYPYLTTVTGFSARPGQNITSFVQPAGNTATITYYSSPLLTYNNYTHYKIMFDRSGKKGYVYLGPNTLVGCALLNGDPFSGMERVELDGRYDSRMYMKNIKIAGFTTKEGAEAWVG